MDREENIICDESYECHEIEESHEYQIDKKKVFIVTPVYFDNGKTIYDVLLSLMSKHEIT